MKEYIKPELLIKALVQDTDLAASVPDGEYGGTVEQSAVTWWPDYAE